MNRRRFLQATALASVGCRLPGGFPKRGYGPLRKDVAGLLDLPAGFQYHVLFGAGQKMDDGLYMPMYPAQIGVFAGTAGELLLVVNHAVPHGSPSRSGPYGFKHALYGGVNPALCYDLGSGGQPGGIGGTVTLVYDAAGGFVKRAFLSLGGTVANGVGCASASGTWLSGETVRLAPGDRYGRAHGLLFEVVPSSDARSAERRPLPSFGTFARAGVCIDPSTSALYQAEAGPQGHLFRSVVSGGDDRLEALRATGEGATWVPIDEFEDPGRSARERGATPFSNVSGMLFLEGAVVFNTLKADGSSQRIAYRPARQGEEHGALVTLAEPCVAGAQGGDAVRLPGGRRGLVVPSGTPSNERAQTLVVCGEGETSYPIAAGAGRLSGPAFDPSGRLLFLSLAESGKVVVVEGPW